MQASVHALPWARFIFIAFHILNQLILLKENDFALFNFVTLVLIWKKKSYSISIINFRQPAVVRLYEWVGKPSDIMLRQKLHSVLICSFSAYCERHQFLISLKPFIRGTFGSFYFPFLLFLTFSILCTRFPEHNDGESCVSLNLDITFEGLAFPDVISSTIWNLSMSNKALHVGLSRLDSQAHL